MYNKIDLGEVNMLYRIEIKSKTTRISEIVNITELINEKIIESKVKSGTVLIFCPHTTAGVIITENTDPDLIKDILWKYAELVPRNSTFDHEEGNSDSHILSTFIGSSQTVIIDKNTLLLGKWQGIFFVELDGPREREVWIKITSD